MPGPKPEGSVNTAEPPDVVSPVPNSGEMCLPPTCWPCFCYCGPVCVNLHHCTRTVIIHVIMRTTRSFWQSFCAASQSPGCTCALSCPGPVAALTSVIAELHDLLSALASALLRSLWMGALPSGCLTAPLSLISSPNLVRVDSVPLPMLMIKMLKRIGVLTHLSCRNRFFKNISVLQYSTARAWWRFSMLR